MIGFRATAADESIAVDGTEILDARWFTREELRTRSRPPDGSAVPTRSTGPCSPRGSRPNPPRNPRRNPQKKVHHEDDHRRVHPRVRGLPARPAPRSGAGARFVGLFSEHDEKNVTAALREFIDEVHILPCGKTDATVAESSYVDPERARELVARVLADPGAGQVTLHSFDERNLLLAADLRAEFGLPGLRRDDVLPFRDKLVMKDRLAAAGIRVPRYGRYDAADGGPAARFEAITERGRPAVRPQAGRRQLRRRHLHRSILRRIRRGPRRPRPAVRVRGVHRRDDLQRQHRLARRRSLTAGVTEYLVNSSAVREGRVNADINLIETDPRVPRMIAFAEDVAGGTRPPRRRLAPGALPTADDALVFLEVAARFKGLAGVAAMQRNYGVALVNLAFEIEAGLASHPWNDEQVYCFDAVIPKQRGVIERLVEPSIESEYDITWKVREGQVLGQGESLGDNGGVFLVWNKDYDVLYRDFERLAGYQPIIYRQEDP